MKFMKRPESQLTLRSFHKFSSELNPSDLWYNKYNNFTQKEYLYE